MYLTPDPSLDYYAIDIETDDLNATAIWCGVAKNIRTLEVHRFYNESEFKRFIEANPQAIFIGHNIIGFDRPTWDRLLHTSTPIGRIIDTLVLSHLYHPNMPGGHSLEAYGIRFGSAKAGLDVSFEAYSQELLDRCVQDVELTARLYATLCKKMLKVGFSENSCRLEHRSAEIIRVQRLNGWYFDIPGATSLMADLRQKERQTQGLIHETIKPELHLVRTYPYRVKADGSPYASYTRHLEEFDSVVMHPDGQAYDGYSLRDFNIGSPSQRVHRLLELGYKPTKFTKLGTPSIDEESLVAFADSGGPEAARLIADWLVLNGRANMIGTWLNNVDYTDSRMHGYVNSCGAATRRMKHSGPNTANVPSNEARYGKECRSLWSVENFPDRCVVGYDAASVQMRVFGHELNNPEASELYIHGKPHQVNADAIGVSYAGAKKAFYSFVLGAGELRLGLDAGGDKRLGRHVKRTLLEVTPGLKKLVAEGAAEWEANKGWIKCIDGGYVRCPEARMYLAYKLQPGEACLMKQASVYIDERARHLDHMKIGDIHDEGQHESSLPDADELGRITTQSIRDAGEELGFRVPMDGDYKVGRSWAETH